MHQHSISIATLSDIDEMVTLVNSAYRGETSKKGWTTEADLLDGIRTDSDSITALMSNANNTILKYSIDNSIVGCVLLENQLTQLYLGMLTVNPELQNKGIGKKLLAAAEIFAKEQQLTTITMSVISIRKELIQWYCSKGYHLTGKTKPFPIDKRFGIPKQKLEFVLLEKVIT